MGKLQVILEAINKTKGKDVIVYDFTSLNPFIDQVVITSADNLRQVFAIANNVKDSLKGHQMKIKSFEGNRDSKWILIDTNDIVVHIFLDEEREVYHLERLYADLPKISEEI